MAPSGGGYLQQSYGITSPNILSPEKKVRCLVNAGKTSGHVIQTRSAGQNQSVLSVTSAMIQAATAASDTFLLEDKEISQVSTRDA